MWVNSVAGEGVSRRARSTAVRVRILDTYLGRLAELDSPIIGHPVWLDQVKRQAEAVLDDIGLADLSSLASSGDGFDRSESDRLSVEIGSTRAMTGTHPAESLRAATILFGIVMAELASGAEPGKVIALSEVLHNAIMRRVGVATISYASFLLQKVHNSHLEERHRMARELHDRAAHAVGVGLQNLELHGAYLDQPERSAAKLETAKSALREALRAVRELSAELATTVGAEGLFAALRHYLDTSVPPGVEVRFACDGDDRALPVVCTEEVYLVLREAVRNALVHGDPGRIEVSVSVGEAGLHAVVSDDGAGFEVAAVNGRAGLGLMSMRERMALLGGSFELRSAVGEGTVVDIRVRPTGLVR